MEWFASFYTTQAMFDSGLYQVRRPIYDLAARQGVRPIKMGELYSMEDEQKKYEVELANYLVVQSDMTDEEKVDYTADEYEPAPPLTLCAWSFANGPLEEYAKHEQIAKFDTTTLAKIVASQTDPIPATGIPGDRASLIKLVEKIVYDEYDTAEMALECHPVLELVSGVLCLGNDKWLSKADAERFTRAHGAYSIDNAIEKQMALLQEMVDKKQTGEDCRGYNRVRSILKDNKKTLGLPITREDEPESSKRERANDDDDECDESHKRHKSTE